jgi:hypothetical protein
MVKYLKLEPCIISTKVSQRLKLLMFVEHVRNKVAMHNFTDDAMIVDFNYINFIPPSPNDEDKCRINIELLKTTVSPYLDDDCYIATINGKFGIWRGNEWNTPDKNPPVSRMTDDILARMGRHFSPDEVETALDVASSSVDNANDRYAILLLKNALFPERKRIDAGIIHKACAVWRRMHNAEKEILELVDVVVHHIGYDETASELYEALDATTGIGFNDKSCLGLADYWTEVATKMTDA